MDRGIFGSTNSLGGLLNDELFTEGEADQFLQELGGPLGKGLETFAGVGGSSASSGTESELSGATGLPTDSLSASLPCCPPTSAGLFPTSLPTTASAAPQGWPASSQGTNCVPTGQQQSAPLALLSQLLTALQPSQQPALQPTQQQQGGGSNLLAQFAAFKQSAPPAQAFAPVAQATVSPPVAATAPAPAPAQATSLPNLTAQQQAALQTIMSLGQFGGTAEGKKVRRMLSNRESARRSRHRKQAHVLELEERAAKLEDENERMQQALSGFTRASTEATVERTRLYAEIASLQSKVAKLESMCGVHGKVADVKVEGASKRDASHASSAGAGHASEDSCCDSIPARPIAGEPCCKRCRVLDAAAS